MASSSFPTWLALSDGGPVADLASIVGARTIQMTTDPLLFADLLRSARPRVAIISTPPAGPADIEVALDERRRRSSLRVVLISPLLAIAPRLDALRAGADEALADTIDPTELGARLAAEPDAATPDDLSERELEVLRLIALGHTNNEIAEQLYLSVRTVESHRAHIQQKLAMTTRSELVRYAIERGLIDV